MLYYYCISFVQIVLESFPISSSAHAQLLELFLRKFNLDSCSAGNLVYAVFPGASIDIALLDYFLHGATVIVVALFFVSRWYPLLRHCCRHVRLIFTIIGLTFLADCVTACFFIFFKMSGFSLPVFVGLMITAALLYSLRLCPAESVKRLNWRMALVLGAVQGAALLPGISRFASTYVAGRWLGFSPRRAFEISWLIQWPLILAAFLLSLCAMPQQLFVPLFNMRMIVTLLCAMIIAYLSMHLVFYLAKTKRFWWFSLYMIVPLVLWIWLSV